MRPAVQHGRKTRARRRSGWGAVLGAAAVLQVLIAGACVLVPAAPARAADATACSLSGNEATVNMDAGAKTQTGQAGFLTQRFDCTTIRPGATLPSMVHSCLTLAGGGQRTLTYEGSAASFPYELRLATGFPQTPIVQGVYYVDGVGSAGMSRVYAPLQLNAIISAPGSASGAFRDTITGYVFLEPISGDCGNISRAITDVKQVTMTLTVNVKASCYIAAVNDLNFTLQLNATGDRTADSRDSGDVTVRCPSDTGYTIYLGKGEGANANALDRRLHTASGPGQLVYRLLKPSGDVWSEGGGLGVGGYGGVSGTGNGLNQTYAIGGLIQGGQVLPPSGDYTDRVIITVVY